MQQNLEDGGGATDNPKTCGSPAGMLSGGPGSAVRMLINGAVWQGTEVAGTGAHG